jgi:hypothetical protein
MIPSLIGGGLVGIYPGYKVYEYVWKDAAFCTSCHVHDYATVGWENSSHQRLTTCHDCHHQPLHEYVREMVVLLTKNPKFPKDLDHIPYIPDDLCQACHISNHQDLSTVTGPLDKEDIDKLHKVDKTKMHQLHFQHKTKLKLLGEFKIKKIDRMGDVAIIPSNEEGKERPITCSDCHGGPSNRAHNFSATDSACVRCHQDEHKKKIGKEFGCRNCHFQDFMIPTSKNPTK